MTLTRWAGQAAKAGVAAVALFAGSLPVQAAADEQAELQRARQEVEKARVELQRATRELARSIAKVEKDNPRAQYFEYITNPRRAVLGVLISDEVEHGEDRGVRLLAVTPGSGADKAGLKAGDLLLSLNGSPLARKGRIAPQRRMREALIAVKAGDEVKAEYERNGRRDSTTIVTQAPEPELAIASLPMLQAWLRDENFEFEPPPMPMFHLRGAAIRGLELAKLDEDLGSYFKTQEGVLVVKAPRSGALNLKSGDVIQKINGDAVAEPITVLDKLRSRGAEQRVKLEVMRQGRSLEIEGKIPAAGDRRIMDRRRQGAAVVDDTDNGHEDPEEQDGG